MKAEKDRRVSERADLARFVCHYFEREPELTYGDRPDLIVNLDGKVIGVEHTRIYRTSGAVSGLEPHAQLAVQHRIVDLAWKEYSATSPHKLWLLVSFDDVTTYKMRESQAAASQLVRVVSQAVAGVSHHPRTIEWHELESWQLRGRGVAFPEGVRRIDFQIVDDNPKLELWGPAHTYMVPHLPAERIRERISEKEERIQDYLSKCDEAWLLVVIDTGVPSNHFEADDELLATEFRTAFSKVILLRSFHSELFELKVLPKVI
jgi:hypothetical protein